MHLQTFFLCERIELGYGSSVPACVQYGEVKLKHLVPYHVRQLKLAIADGGCPSDHHWCYISIFIFCHTV